MWYIATFHTHLAALSTYRALCAAGARAQLAPVPRTLSASCGTCVRYEADSPREELLHRDFERVVRMEDEQTVVSNRED